MAGKSTKLWEPAKSWIEVEDGEDETEEHVDV